METPSKENKSLRTGFFEYAEHIVSAKLDAGAKGLLWLYAFNFNWTTNGRSFWGEERICAALGMAPSTFQTKKKYLEKLGWIKCWRTGDPLKVYVKPLLGRDDPDYEMKCWAKWHPSNKIQLSAEDIATLSDEELDTLEAETALKSDAEDFESERELVDSKSNESESTWNAVETDIW